MNAFITNNNAKKLVHKLDTSKIDINEKIYDIEFEWFSKYEIRSLLAFKLLFKNPEEFFRNYVPKKRVDTLTYIFEGKSPAYHHDDSCEKLLSNFFNIKIPEEIQERGKDEIIRFRDWYNENKYLINELPNDIFELKMQKNIFNSKMQIAFGITGTLENVNFENSGINTFEDLDLATLKETINNLIYEANQFYKSSDKNEIILDEFIESSFIYKQKLNPYNNYTVYSNEEIWEVLREFDLNYKSKLISLLQEYYKVEYNPKLKFEGQLLEQLGFKPCSQCCDEDYLIHPIYDYDSNPKVGNTSFQINDEDLPF